MVSLSDLGIWVMVASWDELESVPSPAVFWKGFKGISGNVIEFACEAI